MQAVVKTPHIEIMVKGDDIPERILSLLRDEYGENVQIVEEDDDELVDVTDTDWYKTIKKSTLPSENMKIYRELHGMTQAELGEKLGGLPRQHISNMENGKRAISLNVAKKLAKIFDVPVDRFV